MATSLAATVLGTPSVLAYVGDMQYIVLALIVSLTMTACPSMEGEPTEGSSSSTGSETAETAETADTEMDGDTDTNTNTDTDTDGETETETETESGETGGPSANLSIEGTVRRTAPEFGDGNDGIGVLYVAALEECGLGAPLLAATGVPMADLSGDDAVAFVIEGLTETTAYLAVFLDDDLDADPQAPAPDGGDLVFADLVGDGVLRGVAVEVAGEGVDGVELVLNAVVPAP